MNTVIKVGETETKAHGMVVFSDETKDSAKDIVRQSGWDLERFSKNPVMLYGHNFSGLPMGKWVDVEIRDSKLMGRPVFASDAHPEAAALEKLYEQGFLVSTSVSFKPIEWKELDDGGAEYMKQELLEVSWVPVPANPNALSLAKQKNIITQEEVELLEGLEQKECKQVEEKAENEIEKKFVAVEKATLEIEKSLATLTDELDILKERLDRLEDKSADDDPAAPVLSVSDNPQETTPSLPDKETVLNAMKEAVNLAAADAAARAVNRYMGRVED